jgi:hypothetical protein
LVQSILELCNLSPIFWLPLPAQLPRKIELLTLPS